jgi:hypothetical protein
LRLPAAVAATDSTRTRMPRIAGHTGRQGTLTAASANTAAEVASGVVSESVVGSEGYQRLGHAGPRTGVASCPPLKAQLDWFDQFYPVMFEADLDKKLLHKCVGFRGGWALRCAGR